MVVKNLRPSSSLVYSGSCDLLSLYCVPGPGLGLGLPSQSSCQTGALVPPMIQIRKLRFRGVRKLAQYRPPHRLGNWDGN